MAKYGTFVYGSAKYGTGDAGPQPLHSGDLFWNLQIAWGGVWGGTNEAARVSACAIHRGREHYIDRNGSGFVDNDAGTCMLTLDNSDGRYDPYNTGSPIYPNVWTGTKMFLEAIYMPTKVHYRRFTGFVDDIIPDAESKQVTLKCVDGMERIGREDATVEVIFNTDTGAAINRVLDAAHWSGGRSIQPSDNPLTLFAVEDENARFVLNGLASASLGTCFIDKSGNFVYYDRDYNSMTTHDIDQAVCLKILPIGQPWDTVRNDITVYANRWAKTAPKTLWSSPQGIYLDANETKTFSVEFSRYCQPIQPVAGVDFKTGQVLVPSGGGLTLVDLFTVFLSSIGSKSCTVSCTNNTPYGNWLYNLRIRGKEYVNSYSMPRKRSDVFAWVPTPQATVSTKRKFRKQDSTSQGKYTRGMFVIDNPQLQDGNFADAYATALLAGLKDPGKEPTITIETRPAVAFPLELQDKVHLTSAALGIDATYRVGGIQEEWIHPTGQGVKTTVNLQNVVLCTASITKEPIEDNIDDVGDIPTEPGPDNPNPPSPDENWPGGCGFTAFQNGPYAVNDLVGLLITDNPNQNTAFAQTNGMVMRSASHTNRTVLEISAYWEKFMAGSWVETDEQGWYLFTVIGETGNLIATGAEVLGGGQTRRFYMDSGGYGHSKYIKLVLTPGTGNSQEFTAGAVFQTGTVAATDATGDVITGLNVGQYYAVDGTGGPWQARPDLAVGEYGIDIYDATHTYLGNAGFSVLLNRFDGGSVNGKAEQISANYGRIYFQATGTAIYVTAMDNAFDDNAGTMGYAARYATASGTYRIRIMSAYLYNVCF